VTTGEHASNAEHLAEMDRLLREIQVELDPDREAAPALQAAPSQSQPPPASPHEPPPPPPAPPAPPTHDAPDHGASTTPPESESQLLTLAELTAGLLASIRQLLNGYERVLVQIRPDPTPPRPTRPPRPAATAQQPYRRPPDPGVTVTAGPFRHLDAVHEFEEAVSRLPGVREVAVRGYEGSDRAIIEVRLDRAHGG
jgi:hypothetical protein